MRLSRILHTLFVLVGAAAVHGADTIYKKVGDSVVLDPGQTFDAITMATWKHNTDLASEWFGHDTVYYRDFNGRCSLNNKDGSLTISRLTVKDSGSYTPEINDKVLSALKLQVLEPVPKPTVSVKCNNEKTFCNLICEANISPDVGLVTYRWRSEDVVLSNNKELIITTENEENSFICELKNPVSRSSSDEAANPISRGNSRAAAGLAVLMLALIVVLAVVGRFVYYKYKKGRVPKWKEFWCCGKNKAKDQYTPVSGQEPNTSDNHELNGGRPTDTVETVSENASEKPKDPDCDPPVVSAEPDQDNDEGETFYDAHNTFTGDPTVEKNQQGDDQQGKHLWPEDTNETAKADDEDSPGGEEETGDQDKESAEESSSENQGKSDQEPNPKEILQPTKESEDEDSPRDNKETGDQDKESGEDSSTEKQGKSDQGPNYKEIQQPTVGTEDEASPGGEEETGDQDKESAEESSSENPGDSSTGKKPPKESEGEDSPRDNKETGDQDKESAEESSSENQGKSDQARNSKEILPPNIGTEDEASPGGEEETGDQHKEPAKKPSSVDQRDSSPEEKTETSNLDSTEGANWKTPPVIPGTRDPTGNSPVEPRGPETSEPGFVI